MKAKIVKKQI